MTVFTSAKSIFSLIILWVLVIVLPIPVLYATIYADETVVLVPIIIVLLVEAFLLSMLLDTKYTVDDGILYYRSGPVRGKIDILKIRKIEESNSFIKYNTLKPGLSHKGFVIYFNTFDDIYISPENKEGFVKLMLSINPEIQVS